MHLEGKQIHLVLGCHTASPEPILTFSENQQMKIYNGAMLDHESGSYFYVPA
jgi:hypothetical protein